MQRKVLLQLLLCWQTAKWNRKRQMLGMMTPSQPNPQEMRRLMVQLRYWMIVLPAELEQ